MHPACFGDLSEYEQNDPQCERCLYEVTCSEMVRLKEGDQPRYTGHRTVPAKRHQERRTESRREESVRAARSNPFGPSITDSRVVYLQTLRRKPGESLWMHTVRSALLMGAAEGFHEAGVQLRYSRHAPEPAAEVANIAVDSDDE